MKTNLGALISEYSVRNRLDESIPVYSVTNEQGFCTGYFSKEVASRDKTTYKIVPQGFFAYNPSRINVGSVDWQRYEKRVIVSPLYVVFSVSEKLDQQYLLHYLKSGVMLTYIKACTTGSVRDSLKFSALKELPINLRPIEEQRQIAAVLDKVTALIDMHQWQLAKLDELVKARFVEMFGDPIISEKDNRLPQIKEVCTLKAGFFVRGNDICQEYKEGLYPCFGGNGCRGYVSDYTHDGEFPIIGRQGALCGNVQYARGKFHATEHAIVVTPQIPMETYWLYHLLTLLDLNRYATGAAQPGLAVNNLEKVRIPLPELDAQERFSCCAEHADQSKLTIQQSLDTLEVLKKSLMQEYFG